jgi:sulfatase maturation enzyme AslB (radical SAM superfamily)
MLSYPDIQKCILFLEKLSLKLGKPISTFMPTNGTLLTEQSLSFFREHNHQISLSIDSLDGDYDYRNLRDLNNSSSVPTLLHKLDLFQKYSDILRIKIVVMPDVVGTILPTFQELRKL